MLIKGAFLSYDECEVTIHEETRRSNELFVTHFRKTYAEYPDLPIWMVSELCSFGTLSRMFSHLRNVEQGMVARDYGLQFKVEQVVDAFINRHPCLVPHTGFTADWKKNPLWWQV